MKIAQKYKYSEQFPNRGAWDILHPSYLTIGGSGIVGNFGPESPMSNAGDSVSMESGSGAASGAGITGAGSGLS